MMWIRPLSAPNCRASTRSGRKSSDRNAGRWWKKRWGSWASSLSSRPSELLAARRAVTQRVRVGTTRDSSRTSIPRLQFAETFPALAVEAHELHLVDRHVIGRRSVDLDAREQHGQFQIANRKRLLQYVFGRQIVAAGLQHGFQRHRAVIGVDIV